MITSETIFQNQISAMAAEFEANRSLGFGFDVWHNGFEVVERMPQAAALGAVTCHLAIGRLDVRVFSDPCVSPVSEADLAAAITAVAVGAIPDGRVWGRMRFATNDEEFQDFYRDVPAERYNVWFVRRVGMRPERGGGLSDEITAVMHNFEFRYLRAVVDFEAPQIITGVCLISGLSVVVAAGAPIARSASVAIAGQGHLLSPSTTIVRNSAVALAGFSRVTVNAAFVRRAAATVPGQAHCAAASALTLNGSALISGHSQMAAPATIIRNASCAIAGHSLVTADTASVVNVAGHSLLAAAAAAITRRALANVPGQSIVTAAAAPIVRSGAAAIVGQSHVTADATVIRNASAVVSGHSVTAASVLSIMRLAAATVAGQSALATAAAGITRSASAAVGGISVMAAVASTTLRASAAVHGVSAPAAAAASITRSAVAAIPGQSLVTAAGSVPAPASQGPNAPGTAADDAAVGTRSWSTTSNVFVEDGNTAAAGSNFPNQTTHYLKATNFGFSIPTGATIDGVIVEIKRRYQNLTAGTNPLVVDSRVRIIKADASIGSTDRSSATTWPVALTFETYGGSSDLWGETWAPADINDADFGVALSAFCPNADGDDIFMRVDFIRVTVHYTI